MGGGQSKEQQTVILKTTLDSACRRMSLQKDKMTREREAKRLEIGALLDPKKTPKDEPWRDTLFLRGEQLMEFDRKIAGFQHVESKTELLKGRVGLVMESDGAHIPQDIEELICTIIWVAPRAASVDEFKKIKAILDQKFAPAFRTIANAPRPKTADVKAISPVAVYLEANANARVKELFSTLPPPRKKIAERIQALAQEEYNIQFDDDSLHEQPFPEKPSQHGHEGAFYGGGEA